MTFWRCKTYVVDGSFMPFHPQVVDSTTENQFEAKLWIVVDIKKHSTTYLWIHNERS